MKSIKYIFKISILAVGILSFAACEDYLDINESPNAPTSIEDQDLLLADITATTAYNLVGGGNITRFSAQWMQHIANNAAPPTNDTYQFNTSDFNNVWAFYSYAGVLINSKLVIDAGTEMGNWNHVAIAQIMMAHNYAMLTDFFSEIPYTEALQRSENLKPSYDDQETVYNGVHQLLDDAIANIDKASPIAVGGGDFFYGGDMNAWRKLAHSLKARYYLRLSNAPGYSANTQAQLALDALENGMESTADVGYFDYTGDEGAEAPWFQWVSKFATGMQISNYFVNKMIDKNDPRLPIFADTAVTAGTIYLGYPNGSLETIGLNDRSNIGTYYLDPAYDIPLMTYVEQLFIEAEARFRLNGAGDGQAAYTEAVRTHMDRLSGNGEFNTIITREDQDNYLTANPLTDLGSIIEQKYIASFIDFPAEAYSDYRRTGFPDDIQPALNAEFPQIPTRIPYTDTEVNNNAENVPEGITPLSKVWWDAD